MAERQPNSAAELLVFLPNGAPLALTRDAFNAALERGRELAGVVSAAPMQMAQAEPLLSAEELAQALKVKPSWVEEAARQKRIPCVSVGRYPRFRLSEVVEAMRATA